MVDFGDYFFREAFWSHFLSDFFSEFGRPWGSESESVGITLADFFFVVRDGFLFDFWFNFGKGRRQGRSLKIRRTRGSRVIKVCPDSADSET